MMALAGLYYSGKVAKAGALRQHRRAAVLWWGKVLQADPRHVGALCRKGEALFQVGDSTPMETLQNAYDLFDKAASLGSDEGRFLKGRWLITMAPSHGDAKRALQGKKLVDQAADAGMARAHVFLGHCYEFPQNYKPAVFDPPADRAAREQLILGLYKRAAALGDPGGLNDIGSCYATGYGGVEQNFDLAVSYYSRAIAAGSPHAFDNLGTHYETGMGGACKERIDLDKALHFYRKGAAVRCAKCARNLAIAYEEGMVDPATKEEVLARDLDRSEKYFRHALALADDANDLSTKEQASKDLAVLYITRLKLSSGDRASAARNEKKLRAMLADSVYEATQDDVNKALVAAVRDRPRALQDMLHEQNAREVVAQARKLLARARARVRGRGPARGRGAGSGGSDDSASDGAAADGGDALLRASLVAMFGSSLPEDLVAAGWLESAGGGGSKRRTEDDERRGPVAGKRARLSPNP